MAAVTDLVRDWGGDHSGEHGEGFARTQWNERLFGRELYAELRSGAAGRAGEAHLVAFRRSGARGCSAPRELFSYSSERPSRRPRSARSFNNFAVYVRELERRFKGREVRLDETYLARGDGACCPSLMKRTLLRFDRRRDRYVRYDVSVRELRRAR
jgi:hypothetical protein